MIAARVAAVREQIARAAARAGRRPEDVALVAVSKTFPAESVREAFAAGLRVFGENKVQEAEGKIGVLGDLIAQGARFHLVGHLQGNKAKKAASLFDCIHSVDGMDVARRLDASVAERGALLRVFVQVDLAGEVTKHGVGEADLFSTLEAVGGLARLRVEGLMTLPPLAEDPAEARPYFRRLRELRDEAFAKGLLQGQDLSMGMSHDLEVAVEEGSTLVRVGTALFGERSRPQ